MIDALQYEFMRNALMAALLASVACGIIGTYVVLKRLVFISGGIAHAAFGGVGLGYLLGINPILGVIPFSLFSAIGIGLLSRKTKLAEDTTIGVFWAAGMALGVVFIGLSPGYAPDLFSYLFGNILTVPFADIKLMAIVDIIIFGSVALFYKQLLAFSFDEEFARLSGLKVNVLYLLLLSLVALTVVMLVRIVGIILVIALMTMPAAIARQYARNIRDMMILSVLIGAILTVSGLFVSYYINVASGATIILMSAGAFFVSAVFKGFLKRLKVDLKRI